MTELNWTEFINLLFPYLDILLARTSSWRRQWHSTPVLLPGESHGQGILTASVQFSCSVVSNSVRPHGLQHSRLPCPSPTPRATETHVPWVSDAIQPSHPLSFPSPPAFNLSWHQGLFQSVSSSHQVAKVLEFQFQHQSSQWTFRTDFL